MSQDNLTEQPIKTLDGLQNTHQKLTPQILEELKGLLKEKYGINVQKEIFHITREELDTLKAELDSNVNPKHTLEKFLYDEYIETKLELEGVSAVSLDTVTSGIESDKVQEIKEQFLQAINPILDSYSFLPSAQKEVIKLALANKFLESSTSQDAGDMIGGLQKSLENFDLNGLKDAGEQATKKDFKSSFEAILTPYIGVFDKIEGKLNTTKPTLTKEQKQNIIGQISYFKNPVAIESGVDENILQEVDIANKDKKLDTTLSQIENEALKKYLLKSRNEITSLLEKMQGGEQMLQTGLDIITQDGLLGESAKGLLGFLLKIPFIGKLLAIFLGLDSNDPSGDLDKQANLYKSLKNLKSLGIQKDQNGNKTEKGESELQDMDLSEIEYSGVKSSLKELDSIAGGVKSAKFWKEAFSKNGTQIGEHSFHIELTPEIKKDEKIDNKEFKEMVKRALDSYKKASAENKPSQESTPGGNRENKAQEREQNTLKAKINIDNINTQIASIDSIIGKKYETITNFSNIIGASIDDIEISKILTAHNDFDAIIKDKIGELKYTALLEKDIPVLHTLLAFIQEYCQQKEINNGALKELLKNNSHDFVSYLERKKQPLVAQIKKENDAIGMDKKLGDKIKVAQEIGKKITQAKDVEISSIQGIEFIGEKQQIKIGDEIFQAKLLGDNGAEITQLYITQENVEIQGKKGIFRGKETINKKDFNETLLTLVENGSYQNDKISLTKIG